MGTGSSGSIVNGGHYGSGVEILPRGFGVDSEEGSKAVTERTVSSRLVVVLAAIVGVILPLLLVELLVRGFDLDRPTPPPKSDRPRVYYFDQRKQGTTSLPRSIEKGQGVYRVAVIGDSFTFGPWMQVDDLYSARLERILNFNAGGRPVEVLNFGVSGFSTSQEVSTLKFALKYNPDLVVLQITLNDPELEPFRARDRAKRAANETTFWDGVRGYWRTLNFVDMRIKNTRSHQFFVDYHRGLFEDPRSWGRFQDAVSNFQRICREQNVPLVSFLFPMFSYRLDEQYPFTDIHKKVEAFITGLSIPFLDLSRFYRALPPDRLQVLPGVDSHPNEIAHRIAAENIYRQLVRWKVVPEENVARVGLRARESRPFEVATK